MSLTFDTAKIVGTPKDGFWSQVHTFTPQDTEKLEKRGSLFAVIVLSGVGEGVEAITAGREVLGRLHEEYFGNLEGDVLERLKRSVLKLASEFNNLEITSGVIINDAFYITIFGEGRVLLKREGKTGYLLKGEAGRVLSSSGYLKDNDIALIASPSFWETVSNGTINVALENNNLEEADEVLNPVVLGRNDPRSASILFKIKKEIKTESEQEFETETQTLAQEAAEEEEVVEKETLIQERPKEQVILPLEQKSIFSSEPIYIKDKKTTNKKRRVLLAGLLLFLLLGSLSVFGYKKYTGEKKKKEARLLLQQAEETFSNSLSAAKEDINKGKVLGAEAKGKIEESIKIDPSLNDEGQILSAKIENFTKSLGEENQVEQLNVFMDFNLIKDGLKGLDFTLYKDSLVILGNDKKIYLLDNKKKANQAIDKEINGGKIVFSDGKAYLFGDEGIYEILPETKQIVLKINKDSEWGDISGASVYSGNLYLLDKKINTIWRYASTENGFGKKAKWFSDESPNLTESVGLAVDGSVWILLKDNILKYNLGKQESFSLSKMPYAFKTPIKIYTGPDLNNLYVLDKEAGKVFVIGKSGEFLAVYSNDNIKNTNSLVVSETDKTIWLLSEEKIYTVGIK